VPIKAEAPARLDLLERREWEAPMKSQPALDALKIDRRLSNAIEKEDLRPIDSGYAKEEIIYVARLSEATLPKSETAGTRLDRAQEVKALVENEGRKAILIAGDISSPEHCRSIIKHAVDELGGIDILVNNAAHQATFEDISEISDKEWQLTFEVNIHSMFYLTKAAVPHMKPGSAIINTTSINADAPNPILLAYATTKGAIQNFTGGLAQMLAKKGIRVNAVAPGPIWTPLIPSTMPEEAVRNFGEQVPMKRAGQPAELATAFVMLADPLSSYTSGTTVAVTGGKPFI
jgi:NAD(P)-dependent dehydrogenase (short-subunit alcohol dehydrogenase family)